jgi:hypothetical protein
MSRERYNLSIAVFVLVLREMKSACCDELIPVGWTGAIACLPVGLNMVKHFPVLLQESWQKKQVCRHPLEMTLAHTMHVWTESRSWVGHYFICQNWDGIAFLAEPEKHAQLSWEDIALLPEDTIPYVRQAIKAISKGQTYSEYGWEKTS